MQAINRRKAQLLYDAIDARRGSTRPRRAGQPLVMNVTFRLADAALEEPFLKEASRPRAARTQRASLRGRLPRLDLQRHAGGGRAGAPRFHGRILPEARQVARKVPRRKQPGNNLGTVLISVPRKWDCPLLRRRSTSVSPTSQMSRCDKRRIAKGRLCHENGTVPLS